MTDLEIVDEIERLMFCNEDIESIDSSVVLDFLAKLLDSRSKHGPRGEKSLCRNCKQSAAGDKSHSLCNACYAYMLRTGKRRPKNLWLNRCSVCDRPRKDVRSGSNSGLCRTCYQYKWKYKRDRSESMIKARAPLGWCDCGEPVVHVGVPLKTLTVDRQYEKVELYDLCETCYKHTRE